MRTVGLRELKNQLSKYVQRARDGETVLITDRGAVVAELKSPGKSSSEGGTTTIEELRRRGLLYGGGRNDPSRYPATVRALKRSSASSLLDDERGLR